VLGDPAASTVRPYRVPQTASEVRP
jgi:hypothetical protein